MSDELTMQTSLQRKRKKQQQGRKSIRLFAKRHKAKPGWCACLGCATPHKFYSPDVRRVRFCDEHRRRLDRCGESRTGKRHFCHAPVDHASGERC